LRIAGDDGRNTPDAKMSLRPQKAPTLLTPKKEGKKWRAERARGKGNW